MAQARAFASKAAEQAARIAGIIAMFDNPRAVAIGIAAMDGAIELVKFYLGEHLRLMGTGKQEQTDKRLRVLWEWLQRGILHGMPRAVRNLKTIGINALLAELTHRGHIRPAGSSWDIRYVATTQAHAPVLGSCALERGRQRLPEPPLAMPTMSGERPHP